MHEYWKSQKNSGFTLVEMIAVVLIIGIVSAGAIITFSSVNRAKANSCADKIVKMLDQTRGEAMSRVDGEVRLEIRKDGNAYYGILYINAGMEKDRVELGAGDLVIEFIKDGTPSEKVQIDEEHFFTVKFKKGNGAFDFDSDPKAPEFDKIVITGSNVRTIQVYRETGRCKLQ